MSDIQRRCFCGLSVESNPFLTYGEAASQTSIVGKLLKFSKGDYLAGQEEDEVPQGTELVANMDEMLVGWIKWEDSKPIEQIMGKVSEGYQPPRRSELGDTDENKWELDADGHPRDPWQLSNYLLMKGGDLYTLYTFTTSSKGGLGALGVLCKTYGKLMSQHPNAYPVVALGVNSYNHPKKEYGRIKFPVFSVIAWAPKTVFEDDEPVMDADPNDTVKPFKARI